MTEVGIAHCPRYAERTGLVIGRSRQNNSIRVLFDGYKSPVSLHPDYIEQIPSEENVIHVLQEQVNVCMPPSHIVRRTMLLRQKMR
jgi:hypothetical protein